MCRSASDAGTTLGRAGSGPAADPGSAPGSGPAADPSSAPGSGPGADPGSAPGSGLPLSSQLAVS